MCQPHTCAAASVLQGLQRTTCAARGPRTPSHSSAATSTIAILALAALHVVAAHRSRCVRWRLPLPPSTSLPHQAYRHSYIWRRYACHLPCSCCWCSCAVRSSCKLGLHVCSTLQQRAASDAAMVPHCIMAGARGGCARDTAGPYARRAVCVGPSVAPCWRYSRCASCQCTRSVTTPAVSPTR